HRAHDGSLGWKLSMLHAVEQRFQSVPERFDLPQSAHAGSALHAVGAAKSFGESLIVGGVGAAIEIGNERANRLEMFPMVDLECVEHLLADVVHPTSLLTPGSKRRRAAVAG